MGNSLFSSNKKQYRRRQVGQPALYLSCNSVGIFWKSCSRSFAMESTVRFDWTLLAECSWCPDPFAIWLGAVSATAAFAAGRLKGATVLLDGFLQGFVCFFPPLLCFCVAASFLPPNQLAWMQSNPRPFSLQAQWVVAHWQQCRRPAFSSLFLPRGSPDLLAAKQSVPPQMSLLVIRNPGKSDDWLSSSQGSRRPCPVHPRKQPLPKRIRRPFANALRRRRRRCRRSTIGFAQRKSFRL